MSYSSAEQSLYIDKDGRSPSPEASPVASGRAVPPRVHAGASIGPLIEAGHAHRDRAAGGHQGGAQGVSGEQGHAEEEDATRDCGDEAVRPPERVAPHRGIRNQHAPVSGGGVCGRRRAVRLSGESGQFGAG
eukprot:ctg_468.g239